ncbi:sugar phosphate isomerase/epimerase [Schaalia sp. 19OD2882]|uniref:sugar phosphate isomerase/epimerase family protein n=1 Tax=Schaalia sp. 19OD2882 TaxID=2794089 RepID=UPI001C1EE320|nr:sugar phosphate isomerase/epimerase family protein [Schaalia sp. 19OD2882]QWW19221.1 sugar phosphate isomerase/epimerase [Schaalia sp. 19OD2882]
MGEQVVDRWRRQVREQFLSAKRDRPDAFERRIDLSWSNWGFGLEDLEVSCARLAREGLSFIELHGNHYGDDLGYDVARTRRVLDAHGLSTSGVCGMFSDDNDLSSNRPLEQQAAIDYIRREVAFTEEMGGQYLLVVPGSVGRPDAYDSSEFPRSVQALRTVAEVFVEAGVKAAIEPIRSAEVSLVHTVEDAVAYIEAVDHPGVAHINGDVYHMLVEEANIPLAILDAGQRLVNLHMADTNRLALGKGSMDLDTIIMALYLIGMNTPGRFVTPEPLGPGAGPYAARTAVPDAAVLDALVHDTITYFREREEAVLAMEE